MDSIFIIVTVAAGAALLRLQTYVRFACADLHREGQAILASCFGLSVGGGYAALIGVGEAVDGSRPAPVVLGLVAGGAVAAYLGTKVLAPSVLAAPIFKKVEPGKAISAVEGRAALLATYAMPPGPVVDPVTGRARLRAVTDAAPGEVHLPAPRRAPDHDLVPERRHYR